MKINISSERGSILMIVVIFVVVISTLGYALIYMNGNEYMAVRRQIMDSRAAFLADAGLELGRGFLYYCDARLEDQDDLEIAENITHGHLPHSSYRYQVYTAMQPNPAHGNACGHKEGDGVYHLYTNKTIDAASPGAWCDVWIASAADNMSSTDGVYEYTITARGVASFGFPGCFDSVKEETVQIRMSSITVPATSTDPRYADWPVCDWSSCKCYHNGAKDTKHLAGFAMNMGNNTDGNKSRYFFQYNRDSGRSFSEKPTEHVMH